MKRGNEGRRRGSGGGKEGRERSEDEDDVE